MWQQLDIRALGGLSIELDGQPVTGLESRKVPALLLYLVYTERPQAREVVGELLWPERSRAQILNRLGVVLSNLRKALHPAFFLDQPKDPITLNPDLPLWLDTRAFEQGLTAALHPNGNYDPVELEATIALYQGDFLEGYYVNEADFDDWALVERERLRLRMMDAADCLIRHYLETARYRQGIQLATRVLQMDDLREQTHRLMMDLLHHSGQRIAALRQYDTLSHALATIDAQPAAITIRLLETIQQGQSIPEPPPQLARIPQALSNPYKGLRPFEEADAPLFFGREALVAQLIARLSEDVPWAHFLAVVGPSGSGKSSVVRAGLISALRDGALPGSQRWRITSMLPGTQPFIELEDALLRIADDPPAGLLEQLESGPRGLMRAVRRVLPADRDTELLLVIDQFEELFALTENETIRQQFLDSLYIALSDPHSRLRVIVTLRGDFYDRPLQYTDFGELVRQRTEAVLPMTPTELERAIVGPAHHVRIKVESELITTLVTSLNDQPGALPLLQYTLWELVELRSDHSLALEAYHAIGGVHGTIARRADELYSALPPHEQTIARQFFLRLVQIGEGTEDTRRRVLWTEVAALAENNAIMRAIADRFGAHRLLTFDQDPATGNSTVEIAHEALIREWAQLRTWLDESRDDIRLQRLLATAAQQWRHHNHDTSYLLHGSRLEQFAAWSTSTNVALTADEHTFLDASLAEQQCQQDSERERQQRELDTQRRSANRLRYLVAAMAVFLVVAVGLTLLAFGQRSSAQEARDRAQRQADVNQSLVQAKEAEELREAGRANAALALALEAAIIPDPPADAVRTLQSIATGTGPRGYLKGHTHGVHALAIRFDGQRALSGGCAVLTAEDQCTKGEIILWNIDGPANTVGEIMRWNSHVGWVNSLAYSHDGSLALSGSSDGTLALWDMNTAPPTLLHRFEAHSDAVNSIAFSPDGNIAASGSDDATVRMWDVVERKEIDVLAGHADVVIKVVFSPDGQTIASGSADTTIKLWDVPSRELSQTLEGHIAGINQLLFTPDGSQIISRADDTSLRVWDMTSGEVLRTQRLTFSNDCVGISPSGDSLFVCDSSYLTTWDTRSWQAIDVLTIAELSAGHDVDGHSGTIAISADGQRILLGGENGSELLLLERAPQNISQQFAPTDVFLGGGLTVSPISGQKLVTGSFGTGTIVWDAKTGEQLFVLDDDGLLTNEVIFSEDENWLITSSIGLTSGTKDHVLVVWDSKTGIERSRFEEHAYYTHAIAFSPDGKYVLSGSFKNVPPWEGDREVGDLFLWDPVTGETVHRFDYDADVGCVDFSADGRRALVGSWSSVGEVTVWDVELNSPTFGTLLQQHSYPDAGVLDCQFGVDETTFVMSREAGKIQEADLVTGEIIRDFIGHDGDVFQFDTSSDQRYMISGDFVGNVILWDMATSEELRRFQGHTGPVWDLAFTPDGRHAFTTSYGDGTVIQWQISDWTLDDLLAWIPENRYVHELTCEVREQYHIEPLCE